MKYANAYWKYYAESGNEARAERLRRQSIAASNICRGAVYGSPKHSRASAIARRLSDAAVAIAQQSDEECEALGLHKADAA